MADNTSMLNDLIETSKDGENGFRSAAEDAKSAELKATFLRRAEDCAKGASELQQLVSRMGGKPEQGGSVAGAMHRGWMDLKAKVAHRDDLAILEECERGEEMSQRPNTGRRLTRRCPTMFALSCNVNTTASSATTTRFVTCATATA